MQETQFDPWVGNIPWRRKWQPTPVFSPGESHGRRSLAGCSPRGCRVGHDWATFAPLHACCKVLAWTQLVCGDAVSPMLLWCCTSQKRTNAPAVPVAPGIFFQPLSSHPAYHGYMVRYSRATSITSRTKSNAIRFLARIQSIGYLGLKHCL